MGPKKTIRLVSISRTARRFWRDSSATWRWSPLKVSSGSWSRWIHPSRLGAGGRTLRRAKGLEVRHLGRGPLHAEDHGRCRSLQDCDFSLSSSGTCPGDRPKDKKKDTKFVPTCNP